MWIGLAAATSAALIQYAVGYSLEQPPALCPCSSYCYERFLTPRFYIFTGEARRFCLGRFPVPTTRGRELNCNLDMASSILSNS